MENQNKNYLWAFLLLLIIIIGIFLLFRNDKNLEQELYNEGIFIDTTLEITN